MELIHKSNLLPLIIGRYYKLLSYNNSSHTFRRQLYSHGLLPGTKIKLIRLAPLGCPLEFSCNDVLIVMRHADWSDLIWELV